MMRIIYILSKIDMMGMVDMMHMIPNMDIMDIISIMPIMDIIHIILIILMVSIMGIIFMIIYDTLDFYPRPAIRSNVLIVIFALADYAVLPLASVGSVGWIGKSTPWTSHTGWPAHESGRLNIPSSSCLRSLWSSFPARHHRLRRAATGGRRQEGRVHTVDKRHHQERPVVAHYNPKSWILGCGPCREPRDALDPGADRKRLGPVSSAPNPFPSSPSMLSRNVGAHRLRRPTFLKVIDQRAPLESEQEQQVLQTITSIIMPKTGINFVACNIGSAELHNSRDKKYLESVENSGKKTYDIFHDQTPLNNTWINPEYEGKNLINIYNDCRLRYIDKTGQKPQEKIRTRVIKDKKTGMKRTVETPGWSPIREGICPLKKETTLDDFKPFIKWTETKGVHIIRIDIHVDEGYQNAITGERKYNYHAHVIADWTDHLTGRTAKLTKLDTSEMQTVLAESLGMERGESKMVTGLDHVAAPRYREQQAAKHAKELEEEIRKKEKELEEKKKAIEEGERQIAKNKGQAEKLKIEAKALENENTAIRKKLRSNAADVGARVLGFVGKGAIAIANAERDAALAKAEDAAREAESERQAANKAKEDCAYAEKARISAENAAKKARAAMKEYGQQQYEEGRRHGFDSGVVKGREEISPTVRFMEKQIREKEQELNEQHKTIEQLKANYGEKIMKAEKLVNFIKSINPNMNNCFANFKDMKDVGMTNEEIQCVFMTGHLEEVEIPVKYNYKTYGVKATVQLKKNKEGKMLVWFNGKRPNLFKEASLKQIKTSHQNGIHM